MTSSLRPARPGSRRPRRGAPGLFPTPPTGASSWREDQVVPPPPESTPSVDKAAEPAAPAPTEAPAPPPPAAAPEKPAPAAAAPKAAPEAPDPSYSPLPNRWSIAFPDDPRIVKGRLIDPYNSNILKGDKPVIGNSAFLVLTGILDSGSTEFRRLPIGSGVSTANPAELEFFGDGKQFF